MRIEKAEESQRTFVSAIRMNMRVSRVYILGNCVRSRSTSTTFAVSECGASALMIIMIDNDNNETKLCSANWNAFEWLRRNWFHVGERVLYSLFSLPLIRKIGASTFRAWSARWCASKWMYVRFDDFKSFISLRLLTPNIERGRMR